MFAPSYFGPRHFAPRYFAPNLDEDTGGSGVGRLEAFSSRVVGGRYPVFFYREPFKAREEVRKIEEGTPDVVVRAVLNKLSDEGLGLEKVKPSLKPVGLAGASNEAADRDLVVAPETIDAIRLYSDLLRKIALWRQDEEDIAILLLSL